MTHTKTSTFRENLQRAILRACDLWVETFDQSGQRRHIKCLTLENNNLNMILQLRMTWDNSCDYYEDMSPPPLPFMCCWCWKGASWSFIPRQTPRSCNLISSHKIYTRGSFEQKRGESLCGKANKVVLNWIGQIEKKLKRQTTSFFKIW